MCITYSCTDCWHFTFYMKLARSNYILNFGFNNTAVFIISSTIVPWNYYKGYVCGNEIIL